MAAVAGPTPFHPDMITAPAGSYWAATPDNATNEKSMFRGIYVGTSAPSDIVVVPPDGGSAITFKNVPQGSILPVVGIRINSTGTTATDLVLLA